MTKTLEVRTGERLWRIATEIDRARISATVEQAGERRALIHLRIEAEGDLFEPKPVTIRTEMDVVDIQGVWTTASELDAAFLPLWRKELRADVTSQAPVMAFLNETDRNRLTVAVRDALFPTRLSASYSEDEVTVSAEVVLFDSPVPARKLYETSLLVDWSAAPYYDVLRDVSDWWASFEEMTPAPVPALAREPLYSCWYSMHQQVTPERVEKQCRLARELGCKVVIVDDGWQTADDARGYAYCGDWEACEQKMPDMAAHVARVQAIGMKYMLWYSVPFVGVHSKAYKRFKGKDLGFPEWSGKAWVTLDPRFPDVREYLIDIYERAIRDWKLDGFKLDFVDSFSHGDPELMLAAGGGRDFDCVQEAADTLMAEINRRLRAINPDVLIEFRQSYIGPMMRKYGNMFRAGDCPNDYNRNRVRTLAIRLLSGATPPHADMFIWHADEPAANAARQFIHTLFAVPQVSVPIDKVPAEHVEVIGHWARFFSAHNDVLLGGRVEPLYPRLGYPVVRAVTAEKMVVAVYADMVAPVEGGLAPKAIVVNGSTADRVILDLAADEGTRKVTVRDLAGRTIDENTMRLARGLNVLDVPACGYAEID